MFNWLRILLSRWRQPSSFGKRGERAAERYLRQRGYRIVARGYRDRHGELDLIAVQHRAVIFIEVKSRRSHSKGHPVEAVDHRKQCQIARLALAYMKRHHLLEFAVRFDIVAITWPAGRRRPEILHILDAFRVEDEL